MDIVETFQAFRQILCICPHCSAMSKLGDLPIRYKGQIRKTWLDDFEMKMSDIDKKDQKFDEKEESIREEARERGRKKVSIMIKEAMNPKIVNIGYDVSDIKALMHPIEFIAFDGLRKDNVTSIDFLSQKSPNKSMLILKESIKEAVKKKQYEWKLVRIGHDGKIVFE
jgi:predicted Holliday junction resolvase-like endonuclease